MRNLFFALLFIFGIQTVTAQSETTTYYFIRHADKVLANKKDRDPDLTKKGYARAQNWAKVLSDVKFDMVYSSNYKRTIETARPTAKANDVEIKIYNPKKPFDKKFKNDTKGKTVLIVGHSNSSPTFVNTVLGKSKYEEIDESNYTNLYIVHINKASKTSTLLHIGD